MGTIGLPSQFALEEALESGGTVAERITQRPVVAPLTSDEWAYDEIGRSIAAGRGFQLTSQDWVVARAGAPTAYAGSVYPLFIGLIYRLTGGVFAAVVLVQIALAGLLIVAVQGAAGALGGPRVGVLGGWAAALHPGLMLTPSLMMTEALSTVAAAGGVWLITRPRTDRRTLALGVLVGLGFLIRSPLGLMLAVAAAVLTVLESTRRARDLLVVGGLAMLTVTPWALRNYRVFGELLITDTKAGATFWNFNHPNQRIVWEAEQIPAPRVSIAGLSEPEASRALFDHSLDYIRTEPAQFLGVSGIRATRFWWPIPRHLRSPPAVFGVAGYVLLTLLAWTGIVRLLRERGPAGLALAAGIGVYWITAAFVAAGLRHRLTIEPLIVVAAALGAIRIWQLMQQDTDVPMTIGSWAQLNS